jgi:hypothetical protein
MLMARCRFRDFDVNHPRSAFKRMKRSSLREQEGSAFGSNRTFAAARAPSSARGQVARGTFSGPRSRGPRCGPRAAAPSTPTKRGDSQDAANGTCARTPNHLPGHHRWRATWCRANDRCTGRWWCPRAEAPFAVSWLSPRLAGVDGAAQCGLRWCPASVGRRTGAPPAPCGTVARGLDFRGQPQPPALAPTHGRKADAQRSAKGRKQSLTKVGPFQAQRAARRA